MNVVTVDMRNIQYQGETLLLPLPPYPFPLVLAFHLVLHNFYIKVTGFVGVKKLPTVAVHLDI